MALNHNASNLHVSLTPCTSPLLRSQHLTERPLEYVDPATCAHCQSHVKTAGSRAGMLATFKPRRAAVKGGRIWDAKLHRGSCLYPQSCAGNIHSREAPWRWPLHWVRGGGRRCEGDSASLGHLLTALSPLNLTRSFCILRRIGPPDHIEEMHGWFQLGFQPYLKEKVRFTHTK